MAAGPICGLSEPTESRAPLILIGLIQIMLQDLFPTSNPHISYPSPCTLRREKRGRKWTFILLRVFIQSFAIKTDRYPRLGGYSMGMKGRVSRSPESRPENVKNHAFYGASVRREIYRRLSGAIHALSQNNFLGGINLTDEGHKSRLMI